MKILYNGNIYEHFNYNNPLVGGVGDNKKVDPKALKKGEEFEKEHIANNKSLSVKQKHAIEKDIARDHIVEFPNYYEELPNMEDKLGRKHKDDKYGKAYKQEKKEEK